jgi:hypothetical protein
MVLEPPSQFRRGAGYLGSVVSVDLLRYTDYVQLDYNWRSLLSYPFPSFDMVHGTHLRREVLSVRGVPTESWEVFAQFIDGFSSEGLQKGCC